MVDAPTTLAEAILHVADPDNALKYLVSLGRPNGLITCPHCGSENPMFLATHRIWKCRSREYRKQFSAKVGTIFEDSPLPLDKWQTATWLIANCRNGISSYEIAHELKVTRKTAWFMLHRIREAMQDETTGAMLGGEVEAHETFIGGKARNKADKDRKLAEGKAIVAAVLERGGRVRAKGWTNGASSIFRRLCGIIWMPDRYSSPMSYDGLSADFEHQVINHAMQYVDEQIHTNKCESFWSLLKRSLRRTYVRGPFTCYAMLTNRRSATTRAKTSTGKASAMQIASTSSAGMSWGVG